MKTYIVDAFTKIPYSGNPAGVCILDYELPDNLMAKIAREINHSETAFLLKIDDVYPSFSPCFCVQFYLRHKISDL